MAKKIRKKVTTVREHPLHVPVSEKNPTGVTIRDRHLRRLKGTYLDAAEIESILQKYDRKGIVYPTKGKLITKYKSADNYDEVIAVWTDYFNKKFNSDPPLDPDVVKALIASESSFNPDPLSNRKIALGIAQITKKTLKILQDPKGEAKEFIFKGVRQKDLKNPNISIPMSIRWLHRKIETAAGKLQRVPRHEEIILEYKGLLKSTSNYKKLDSENTGKIMLNLKNSAGLLSLCFLISACQSTVPFTLKTFSSAKQDKAHDLHIIHVNSDRVRQKCLFLNAEAENNWRHQYFMYILNDKHEVIEVMQPTHLDNDSCRSQFEIIEKLLRSESKVNVCARDELKKNIQSPETEKEWIQFDTLGSHQVSYDPLTLDSICNSTKCFSNNEVWVNTCPGFVKH